jgi:hypothetical protein
MKKIIDEIRQNCKPLTLMEIAKCHNLTIWHEQLPENILGMLFTHKGEKFIIVSQNVSCLSRQIIVAHGIGRFILNPSKATKTVINQNTFLKPSFVDRKANELAHELHRIIGSDLNPLKKTNIIKANLFQTDDSNQTILLNHF